jgi:hypothetical protein
MARKCNLTERLIEKSKLAQHANEEGHKICCKETKMLHFERMVDLVHLPSKMNLLMGAH